MISFLISYQRKFYEIDKSVLILTLSTGPSFFSSKLKTGLNQCDTILCNLPDVRLSILPGLFYILQIYQNFAIQFGAHYNLLLGNKQDILPFKSGIVFSAGLFFELDIKQ